MKGRLGWWAPWRVTDPWLPRVWRGSDEYHNPAVSVVVPFLGAFHYWFTRWSDATGGHFTRVDGCGFCADIFDDEGGDR